MTETLQKIRQDFKEEREALFANEELLKDSFDFCIAHSLMIEEYIRRTLAGIEVDCVLVSSGSFSRLELSPYSDIDIMFICDSVKESEQQISQSVGLLWDAGIEVSHTVREFSDIKKLLETDLQAFTQFFETRFITGNMGIYERWQSEILNSVTDEYRKKILFEYFDDINLRHKKYGDSPKVLEPNIKFSAGGLRDLHAVEWMYSFKNNYFISDQNEKTAAEGFVETLKSRNEINPKAAKRLLDSYKVILGVRNRLHLITGRKNDRLEFSLQEQIVSELHEGRDGWGKFMTEYFRAANILNRFCNTMRKGLEEKITDPISDYLAIDLDEDFFIKGKLISIKNNRPLSISDILRVFYYRGLHDGRFDENLRSLIIENVEDYEESADPEHASSVFFREILRMNKNVGKTLSAMNELGVLGAFLPSWKDMVGFFQPGVYHCYTADEHTIIAVKNLEKLELENSHLGKIYSNYKNKDIIFLAVLFHDIAKPIGVSGHEILGAEIAQSIMPSLGYEQEEIALVEFLVRHHLTMEQIAFRRNLNDPQTLNNFTSVIPSKKALDLLYLITYADLSAVSPAIWTHWKADLLYELYRKARIMMDEHITGSELLFNETQELMESDASFANHEVKKHLESINDIGYLQHYTGDEINRHVEEIENGEESSVFFKETESYTNITIITRDSENLLARLCGTLSINDINIIGAKIFTRNDGIVIDSFNITDFRTGEVIGPERYPKIRKDLLLAIENKLRLNSEIKKVKSKWWRLENRIFKKKPQVRIEFEEHERFTIIDVFSPDKLGLLYQITREMHELGLSIYLAKISTKADDVVDAFYVLDRNGNKVDSNDYELIRMELSRAVHEIL